MPGAEVALPPGAAALEPQGPYDVRFEIKSASSSRVYIVARNRETLLWGCSCPAWCTRRRCKHLREMGLDTVEAITPRRRGEGDPRNRDRFGDNHYRHYDTTHGFGSAEEWMRQADDMAAGRGHALPPPGGQPRPRGQLAAKLALLGLTELPATARELAKAMRRKAATDHPDRGGDPEDFKTITEAYGWLLERYEMS